jgi:hypothetical protein
MTTPGAWGSAVVAENAMNRFPSAACNSSAALSAIPAPPAIGGSGGRAVVSKHMPDSSLLVPARILHENRAERPLADPAGAQ